MKTPPPLAFVWLAAVACGSVPDDPGPRIFRAQGVIRGTVVYQGPRPCSRDGHIVGNAIVLLFDRRDPPPPAGFASTAVSFADVTGDLLFGNEARYTGPDSYCPSQAGFTESVSASAPFEIAPVSGGSYEIRAFFDFTGNFLPQFTTRNLPEQGDVVGGHIDTIDALQPENAGNPNYQPRFLPVDVGVAQPLGPGAPPWTIPEYVVPDRGVVVDNVTVTVAARVPTPRPYFYPQGQRVSFDLAHPGTLIESIAESSDQRPPDSNDSAPVLTIPQDVAVLAPPRNPTRESVNFYESAFPHLRLVWGVPAAEIEMATTAPLRMQVAPFGRGSPGAGFLVWQNTSLAQGRPQQIPEGGGVPQLWPLVILSKLPSSPGAPASEPAVLLQAITLLGDGASVQPDSLYGTVAAASGGQLFDASGARGPRPILFAQDHLTVLVRPSVICFDVPAASTGRDTRGTLVTPHPTATTADLDCSHSPCTANGTPGQPTAPADLAARLATQVKGVAWGSCLPTGRYAIHVVYPDGQAWTVPNEAGACSGSEGSTDFANRTCTLKPRPVLYSQGSRAVVEIVPAQDPAYCAAHAVPPACSGSP
jgi:hypothetical protein